MTHSYISLAPLISPYHGPRPIDWRAEMGRAAPLELEIGSGNGEYLVRQARDHPERDFVGIEYKWGRVKKTLRKIGLAGVGNARVLYGEAHLALERLFPPAGIAHAQALFPCPWPGDEAGRHRLFGPDFLRLLNSRLIAAGTVRIVTDDRPYADWVLAAVPGTGFEATVHIVGADYGTKFEQKWRGAGRTAFYRLDLAKRAHIHLPLKEDAPMRIHRTDRFDPALLPPRDEADGDLILRFKGLIYDPARRIGMVQAVVVEDRLTQELWIELVPDPRGWRIAPARGCHVVMTDGVQRALDAVYRAVAGSPHHP